MEICVNGTVISFPTDCNGKSRVPPMVSICSGKLPFESHVPFAFHPVGPEILAK